MRAELTRIAKALLTLATARFGKRIAALGLVGAIAVGAAYFKGRGAGVDKCNERWVAKIEALKSAHKTALEQFEAKQAQLRTNYEKEVAEYEEQIAGQVEDFTASADSCLVDQSDHDRLREAVTKRDRALGLAR